MDKTLIEAAKHQASGAVVSLSCIGYSDDPVAINSYIEEAKAKLRRALTILDKEVGK